MDTSVPICIGSIVIFALLFTFLLIWRYINYKETINLAERGLVRPEKPKRTSSSRNSILSAGIIITAIGLALILGMIPLGYTGMGMDFPMGLGPWLLIGLLPLFFGLSLILIHFLNKKEKREEITEDSREDDNEEVVQ